MNIFYVETNIYYAIASGIFDLTLFLLIITRYADIADHSREFRDWIIALSITCFAEIPILLTVPYGIMSQTDADILTLIIRIPQGIFLIRYSYYYAKEHIKVNRLLSVAVGSICFFLYCTSCFYDRNHIAPTLASVGAYLVFMIVESRNYSGMHEMVEKVKAQNELAKKNTEEKNRLFAEITDDMVRPLEEMKEMTRKIKKITTDPSIYERAVQVESSEEILSFLIRDIFDLVNLNVNGMKFNERRFHITEVISDITFMMKPLASNKGLTFECLIDPEVPEIWLGDDIRLRQILVNICGNAVKYTSSGLARLYVSEAADGGLIFVISDTGIGIRKEDIPYIFMRYDNLYKEKNSHISGTGLGLAIADSFVKKMNGTIKIESVYGRGSEFIIRLPLWKGEQIKEEDSLLDTDTGLSFYEGDDNEYRRVLSLFAETAQSMKSAILKKNLSETHDLISLYRASQTIGAKALSLELKHAIDNNGNVSGSFPEIFDETLYKVRGYAGQRMMV